MSSVPPPRGSYVLQHPPPPEEEKRASFFKIAAVGCALLFVGFIAFICVIVFVAFTAVRHSDAYETAFARATHDPRVQAALGTPIESGWFVTGNVSSNGNSGGANLHLTLLGAKQDASVHVVGTREGNEWHYTTLTVKPDHGETIDLLRP